MHQVLKDFAPDAEGLCAGLLRVLVPGNEGPYVTLDAQELCVGC